MVRFLKVNKLLSGLEEFIVHEHSSLLVKFLKLNVMIFFITHWLACFLYSIGAEEFSNSGNSWL
jgi:hypothetical protein